MDIPLPEESQPPGLHDGQGSSGFPQCDNIPLPSCGLQFNTAAFPPPIPPAALPIAAPVLPPEAPLPQQTSEANIEQADDPNRLVCEIMWLSIKFCRNNSILQKYKFIIGIHQAVQLLRMIFLSLLLHQNLNLLVHIHLDLKLLCSGRPKPRRGCLLSP